MFWGAQKNRLTSWSFSYNVFIKFNGKKMSIIYPNLCYNDVAYKGTAMYIFFLQNHEYDLTLLTTNLIVEIHIYMKI